MKDKLKDIYQLMKSLKENERFLSFSHSVSGYIYLSRDRLTPEESKLLLEIARDWNGKVCVEVKEGGTTRKRDWTTFYTLIFGEPDMPFRLQISHKTEYKYRKSGMETLMENWANNLFNETDNPYGYYNGGMVKYAQQINIPFVEEKVLTSS